MLTKIFLFLFGYSLTLIALIFIISYLNLLTIGYNFFEYVNFIIRRYECMYLFFGILFMFFGIYLPGGKNELYI